MSRSDLDATPSREPSPAIGEDDDDIDLPPLDPEEDEGPVGDIDESLDDLRDSDGDPLDDVAAADLDIGADLHGDEPRGADDPAGAHDEDDALLDVGPLDDDIIGGTEADSAEDADGFGHDGDDTIVEEPSDADDGGAEGTGESTDGDVDEADLPELDADEEGDFDGDTLADELLGDQLDEPSLPPQDPSPWVVREGAGAAVPCAAVAVGGGCVIACGDVVLVVDEGAHAARRATFGAATTVSVLGHAIALANRRGQLLVSVDGAMSATHVAAWRARRVSSLCATEDRLWILSEAALWRMTVTGPNPTSAGDALSAPAAVRERGVLAITTTQGALVALCASGERLAFDRLRGDDEGWSSVPVDEPLSEHRADEPRIAAAGGGRALALARGDRLLVSRDSGASFRSLELPGVAALAFAGDDEAAPLLVLVATDSGDRGHLVQLPPSSEPTVVAEVTLLSAFDGVVDEAPRGSAAIVWDGSRDLAWIACRAGLVAIGRARQH